MRTFYNVGDALFIVENVNDKYFIYDCGAQNNFDAETAIRKAFPCQGQIIEAVFISHYDRYHINGIHFLLTHCEVRLLILPLLSKFTMFFLYSNLMERADVSENDIEFVLNTVDYVNQISPNTRIVYIDSTQNNAQNFTNDGITFENLYNNTSYEFTMENPLNSGIKVHPKSNPDWIFMIHNIQTLTTEEEKAFKDKFSSLCIEAGVEDGDIKALWKKKELCLDKGFKRDNMPKEAIQTYIDKLKGHSINSLCLTVYSGPCKASTKGKVGCLYLGDFNAKKYFLDLHHAFYQVWENIGAIQIPHHGSWHNYHEKLLAENTLAIVSLKLPLSKRNFNRKVTLKKIVEQNGVLLATGYRGDIYIEAYTAQTISGHIDILLCCDEMRIPLF